MSLFDLFKKKTKLIVGFADNFTHHDTLIVHSYGNGYFSATLKYFLPAGSECPKEMCEIGINRVTAYPYCESIGISYNYIDLDGTSLGEIKTAWIKKIAYFDRTINKFRVKYTKHYHTYDLPPISRSVKQ
jgi:hypothetical protein